MTYEEMLFRLKDRFGEGGFTTSEFRDNRRVHFTSDKIYTALEFLRMECGFDQLIDISAADYSQYPDARDRYGVWYILLSTETGLRIFVKTFVNDPEPQLPSVFSIWKGADWMEREVYDMFGIVFDDHPDLRRILLPDAFTGHPLRRDYPLRGRGERHNFTPITRADS